VLVAAAVAIGLLALSPDAPAGTTVLVMARDVTAGTMLSTDDVEPAARPPDQLPAGTLAATSDAVGRVLASGARRGEVLTDVRLVGPGVVESLPAGEVAVPVRVADPAAAALVRPGDHVDVLVALDGEVTARAVLSGAVVLARPEPAGSGGLLGGPETAGGLVVLGVGRSDAQALVGAAAQGPLSLALRGS
jgi:Flp pilus assembly protein CpaB